MNDFIKRLADVIAKTIVQKGLKPPYAVKAVDAAGLELGVEMNERGQVVQTNFLRRDQRFSVVVYPVTMRILGNYGQQHTFVLVGDCGCESRKATVS